MLLFANVALRAIIPVILLLLLSFEPAAADQASDVSALRKEIESLRKSYEKRLLELESKLATLERDRLTPAASTQTAESSSQRTGEQLAKQKALPITTDSSGRNFYDNTFNPSIGLVLNGRYSAFSNADSEFAGFAVGEEGERGREGLAIDESELTFAASVDDKFKGSLTTALVREDGEDIVELEEAYFQTLPGGFLPRGLMLKGGRAFWSFGYLNEHHSHADDFTDRPLPYRAFLNNSFNDDGLQLSYLLPTALYSEVGAGIFRGDDYPFGGADSSGIDAWSAFFRVGGDIGDNQSWRLGTSFLGGDVNQRSVGEEDEESIEFAGDNQLYAVDLRYTYAPTGNPRNQEFTAQGEFIWRNEDGTYRDAASANAEGRADDLSTGFYAQAVYKFLPQWRLGLRYSQLFSPSTPAGLEDSALDAADHDPYALGAMIDWTNSEFSRFRLQYNYESLADGEEDNQLVLQYILSIGAHGAHAY